MTATVAIAVILGLGFANLIPGFPLTLHGGGGRAPAAALFAVDFSETGLPARTNWSVAMGGTTTSSSTSTIDFSEPNGTYPYTVGVPADYKSSPASGTVTVSGAVVSRTITFNPNSTPTAHYDITFTETGLPPASSWSMTLALITQSSRTSTIVFTEPNGTYLFFSNPPPGYGGFPSHGFIAVDGAAVIRAIEFAAIYNVTFVENGLQPNSTWSVTLNGSVMLGRAPASIVFESLTNGTYIFHADSNFYSADPANGSVSVSGASVNQVIVFSPVLPSGARYSVTFTQKGLPPDSLWDVSCGVNSSAYLIQGNTGNSTIFSLPNGTFGWSLPSGSVAPNYAASPDNGTFSVAGVPRTITLTFHALFATSTTYAVTFTESGLPASTLWSVTLNTSNMSTGTSIGFSEPNGSYSYDVTGPPGYAAIPRLGTIIVDHRIVVVAIGFVVTHPISFNETGLPSADLWSVDLNGSTGQNYANASIWFNMSAGTYSFDMGLESGYAASPSTGTVTVTNTGVSRTITFTPDPYSATFSESGLPGGDYWSLAVAKTFFHSDGVGFNLAGGPIGFTLPVGNYTWTAFSYTSTFNATGYAPSPFTGYFQLLPGQGVSITVHFASVSAFHYLLVTEASAYDPVDGRDNAGMNWSVTIGGATETTGGEFVYVPLFANGSYPYTIVPPPGYAATPSSGTIEINDTGGELSSGSAAIFVYFSPSGSPFWPHPAPPASKVRVGTDRSSNLELVADSSSLPEMSDLQRSPLITYAGRAS